MIANNTIIGSSQNFFRARMYRQSSARKSIVKIQN
jgi:hypothetical protein